MYKEINFTVNERGCTSCLHSIGSKIFIRCCVIRCLENLTGSIWYASLAQSINIVYDHFKKDLNQIVFFIINLNMEQS